MADTNKLQDMLDNLINDKSEQAQVNFHEYLRSKMQDVVGLPGQQSDNTSETDKE
jgi:hypothetical protein